jgi:hypothetical protein
MTDLTRRRTLATAVWAAPVIVAASAAPAYAGSVGPPTIVTTDLVGVRRTTGDTGRIDVSVTFTNNGQFAATLLTVDIEWEVVGIGSTDNQIEDLASGWSFVPLNGSSQVRFARAGGLGAGASETLTFSFGSGGSARGTLLASPPVTDPVGANSGTTGTWGSIDPIDLDINGVVWSSANQQIIVTYKNNGSAPAPTQTIAVTITPTTGTVAYNNVTQTNPTGYVSSPTSVAATASPTTIEITSPTPLAPGITTSFTFQITETGSGTISATVSDPASPNNNTRGTTYS